jgi:energy-coupling factor transport system ATP-binding protein
MIRIQDLSFRYALGMPLVLKSIGLVIPQGSLIAIMGSNGSGKSTLARCLNGLLRPTMGSVSVDGIGTHDPSATRTLRRKVGLVFQDPNLQMTSMTVERELAFGLENIGISRDEMHSRVGEYLDIVDLDKKRNIPPSSLSGGEKQRLAIASVMILEPSYLVLDESTSLLSARSRDSILDMVMKLRQQKGIAVVLITQYPSEVLSSERLVVLHEGKVVFDDEPGIVLRHSRDLLSIGVPVPFRERLRMVE